MKRERNSSIEMLRIICMILIIAHHYVVHGGITFQFDNNMWATVYLRAVSMFGRSACAVFVLISGYYMIAANTTEGFYRKIIPTIFRAEFCALVVLGVVLLFGGEWGLKDLVNTLPVLSVGKNWYISTYVCFFFFIPFINELLIKLDKKRFQKLLIVIFLLYFLLNTLTFNIFSVGNFYFMLNFYVFGAYYRLHGQKIDNSRNLRRCLICMFIMLLSTLVIVAVGYKLQIEVLITKSNPFATYSNILSFGFSYYLFVYFANKDWCSKAVNRIASTSLSVYMLHDDELIYQLIWMKWYPNEAYINNPYIHLLVKVFLIYGVCVVIDLLRQYSLGIIFKKKVYPWIYKLFDKEIFKKLEEKMSEIL